MTDRAAPGAVRGAHRDRSAPDPAGASRVGRQPSRSAAAPSGRPASRGAAASHGAAAAPGGAAHADSTAVEEGIDRASRIAQALMGALLGVVSALLMVTCHRLSLPLGGSGASGGAGGFELPIGLILGAVLQTACCVFLLASTGRRLGVVTLAVVWFLVALPFAGQSAGGGVLMPAAIGETVQYQGWVVQILGIGIPLLALALCWVQRMRRLSAKSPRTPGASVTADAREQE